MPNDISIEILNAIRSLDKNLSDLREDFARFEERLETTIAVSKEHTTEIKALRDESLLSKGKGVAYGKVAGVAGAVSGFVGILIKLLFDKVL